MKKKVQIFKRDLDFERVYVVVVSEGRLILDEEMFRNFRDAIDHKKVWKSLLK